MRILVTGGAGFIGSRVVNKLYARGHDLVVIDNLSEQIHGTERYNSQLFRSVEGKCEFIERDLVDISDWSLYLSNIDYVLHLAAETGTGQSMYDIERYERVNCLATARMLESIVKAKLPIRRFVVSSSRAVYGEGAYTCSEHGTVFPSNRLEEDLIASRFNPRCPYCDEFVVLSTTSESAAIFPKSIYGVTKYAQERLVAVACESVDIPCTVLRYQNVYGPGQSLTNPYTGILSIFSNLALQNKQINIFEDGLESRDFVYIDDVVDATIAALLAAPNIGGIFNIGTGKATDVLTVARGLNEFYRSSSILSISGNYRIGDIRHNVADISRAREVLEFTPKVDFNQGLLLFCEWVMAQNIQPSDYEGSLEKLRKLGLLK